MNHRRDFLKAAGAAMAGLVGLRTAKATVAAPSVGRPRYEHIAKQMRYLYNRPSGLAQHDMVKDYPHLSCPDGHLWVGSVYWAPTNNPDAA